MHKIDEEIRDVFAAFGQATFLAQKLEGELTNALISLEFAPKNLALRDTPEWEIEFDRFLRACIKKTMGQLLKQISAHKGFYELVGASLEEALNARNYLSHHFVAEKSGLGLNSDGRKQLIQKLQEEQARFREASFALEQAILPIRGQYISNEEFQNKFESYLREERSDLPSLD